MRFRYALVSIVVARLDITLDALLALLRMLEVALLGVDAARRRYLFDGVADDADAGHGRRRRCRRRRRRRRRLVALLITQAAQNALVNRLRRGL